MAERSVRAAIERAISILSVRPDLARKANTPATAVFLGGMACEVRGPNGERVMTDMPATIGGQESAPTPGWYLSAAIASCAASGIGSRAMMQNIQLDRVEVTVSSETDARGPLGIGDIVAAMTNLTMRVTLRSSNADAATLNELVQWVEAHSPVSGTLRAGRAPAVEVKVLPPG